MKSTFIPNLLAGGLMLMFLACDPGKTLDEMAALEPVLTSNSAYKNSKSVSVAYTIQPFETVVDNNKLNLPVGSVIGIAAGERRELTIKNFIGTPSQPFIFVNTGGKTTFKVSTTLNYAWKVEACSFIKLSGRSSTEPYGINIDGGHQGLILGPLTTQVEVEGLEIQNCGFAGIMAKTDPTCDPATWRDNFLMQNVKIHDNYVHHTKGEGLYLGHSFYVQGVSKECGTVYPHEIYDLKVYKNLVTNTGAEAIQVSCAIKGCEVYSNTVRDAGGYPFAANQNNGIQIGAGTGGKLYNNTIVNVGGSGILMFGIGDNHVYNNIIVNTSQAGIFTDHRYTTGDRYVFANNTIYKTGTDGIRMYSKNVTHYLSNNLIVNYAGKATSVLSTTSVKVSNETTIATNDESLVKFVDAGAENFRILSGSIAHDAGISTEKWGVITDIYNTTRPQGKAYEAGATELQETIVVTEPAPAPAPSPGKGNTSGKGGKK